MPVLSGALRFFVKVHADITIPTTDYVLTRQWSLRVHDPSVPPYSRNYHRYQHLVKAGRIILFRLLSNILAAPLYRRQTET